jgi:site-specific DNA-methyltransferase (adenine-specific)
MELKYTLELGDNLATLKNYPDNHFDSIVTDPPYFIDFLGKDWDSSSNDFTPLFRECLRVLKPGGYLLAFSAARTYHKLAVQVERAGFEIRDQLMWLYSSGFPKAQDIGKAIQKRIGVEETASRELNQYGGIKNQSEREGGIDYKDGKDRVTTITQPVCTSPIAKEWEGWKTALKPAHEPIVMARKPYKGSTIDNVLKNGLGAMNIDATRVPWADEQEAEADAAWREKWLDSNVGAPTFAEDNINEQRKKKKKSDKPKPQINPTCSSMYIHELGGEREFNNVMYEPADGRYPSNVIGEVTDYQKYFYCPKVSRRERHVGFGNNCEGLHEMVESVGGKVINEQDYWLPGVGNIKMHGAKHEVEKIRKAQGITATNIGNNHPTVKPIALMEYLIRLVTPASTPEHQRRVLDPFNGSGSTGMAATALGHEYVGCELDPKYIDISRTRIEAWNRPEETAQKVEPELPPELFEEYDK